MKMFERFWGNPEEKRDQIKSAVDRAMQVFAENYVYKDLPQGIDREGLFTKLGLGLDNPEFSDNDIAEHFGISPKELRKSEPWGYTDNKNGIKYTYTIWHTKDPRLYYIERRALESGEVAKYFETSHEYLRELQDKQLKEMQQIEKQVNTIEPPIKVSAEKPAERGPLTKLSDRLFEEGADTKMNAELNRISERIHLPDEKN